MGLRSNRTIAGEGETFPFRPTMNQPALAETLERVPLDLLEAEIMRRRLRGNPHTMRIIEMVAEVFGVRAGDILSRSRGDQGIESARHLAMALMHERTGNLSETARIFGRRCHATVSHAVRRCEAMEIYDRNFRIKSAAVAEKLSQPTNPTE